MTRVKFYGMRPVAELSSWIALFVALACGAAVTPVAAETPVQFKSHIDVVLPEPGLSAACGFQIAVHLQGTDQVAVYFDKNGALSKVIETTPGFFHTFVNVVTGKSYTTVTPASVRITVQKDGTMLYELDGLVGKIIVAGQPISVRAGRTVWRAQIVGPGDIEPIGGSIFDAGPSDPPVPALCEALK